MCRCLDLSRGKNVCFAKFGGGITFLREKDGNLQNHIPMREKRMSTGENKFLLDIDEIVMFTMSY